VLFILNIFLKV